VYTRNALALPPDHKQAALPTKDQTEPPRTASQQCDAEPSAPLQSCAESEDSNAENRSCKCHTPHKRKPEVVLQGQGRQQHTNKKHTHTVLCQTTGLDGLYNHYQEGKTRRTAARTMQRQRQVKSPLHPSFSLRRVAALGLLERKVQKQASEGLLFPLLARRSLKRRSLAVL